MAMIESKSSTLPSLHGPFIHCSPSVKEKIDLKKRCILTKFGVQQIQKNSKNTSEDFSIVYNKELLSSKLDKIKPYVAIKRTLTADAIDFLKNTNDQIENRRLAVLKKQESK